MHKALVYRDGEFTRIRIEAEGERDLSAIIDPLAVIVQIAEVAGLDGATIAEHLAKPQAE